MPSSGPFPVARPLVRFETSRRAECHVAEAGDPSCQHPTARSPQNCREYDARHIHQGSFQSLGTSVGSNASKLAAPSHCRNDEIGTCNAVGFGSAPARKSNARRP
jgi:hypothetical protein